MLHMQAVSKVYRTELVETHALRAFDLHVRRLLFSALFTLVLSVPANATELLSVQQLQRDLDYLTRTIPQTHPDPSHSVAPEELNHALAALREEMQEPLTRDQIWLRLAGLNSQFGDAHFLISFDNWRNLIRNHLEQGGGLFPYEVHVDVQNAGLFITGMLGGGKTALKGARITSINGIDSAAVVRRLLRLVPGDSPAFRAALLASRWPFYYWKAYGDDRQLRIATDRDNAKELTVPVGRQLPAELVREDHFEDLFRFELLPQQAALLTLNSFSWPDKEHYFAFTERAFDKIRDADVQTLIIDVRNNTGGDDDMWMRGVLRYIADERYRWGSTYRKRIVEEYRDEGETVGDVVDGSIESWIEPEPEHPAHFAGKVYLLVGGRTYSSAVLFANVVQDFGFATVVGPGNLVRSRQSGGIREAVLPHSGLILVWPRFIVERPTGPGTSPWFTPDVILHDDPLNPRAAIEAILLDQFDDAERIRIIN